ncbi:hypothetical protein FA09DRAFT_182113 [Tilletiopsis washingtonensis]|uniref:Uncharacterized protein n=1 Tax=Tilletiopsis washingtonensis TaxID=58919 RepID=A0A316ZH05_9BASI|nr:hypothetical protein FA09DRAFT_182113 [Tilletiopsis washingtonensis]PWO00315.1 hypothetical protein FA09DRAFT_182113 [Tilletiopsis washingtonensis]
MHAAVSRTALASEPAAHRCDGHARRERARGVCGPAARAPPERVRGDGQAAAARQCQLVAQRVARLGLVLVLLGHGQGRASLARRAAAARRRGRHRPAAPRDAPAAPRAALGPARDRLCRARDLRARAGLDRHGGLVRRAELAGDARTRGRRGRGALDTRNAFCQYPPDGVRGAAYRRAAEQRTEAGVEQPLCGRALRRSRMSARCRVKR